MYSIEFTNRFKKDVKRCQKRDYDLNLLEHTIDTLQKKGILPPNYNPHVLKGKYVGLWECHIKPDWLLIWKQSDNNLTLLFMNTGTHSDLL
jgi:mRNA interferase YafQ